MVWLGWHSLVVGQGFRVFKSSHLERARARQHSGSTDVSKYPNQPASASRSAAHPPVVDKPSRIAPDARVHDQVAAQQRALQQRQVLVAVWHGGGCRCRCRCRRCCCCCSLFTGWGLAGAALLLGLLLLLLLLLRCLMRGVSARCACVGRGFRMQREGCKTVGVDLKMQIRSKIQRSQITDHMR